MFASATRGEGLICLDTQSNATGSALPDFFKYILVCKDIRTRIAKLKALYVYVGRVLRPMWEQTVTRAASENEGASGELVGRWNEAQRKHVQQKLIEIEHFIQENSPELVVLPADSNASLQRGDRHYPLNAPALKREEKAQVKSYHDQLEEVTKYETV